MAIGPEDRKWIDALKLTVILALIMLPGCALKRHWVSSQQSYDRWWIEQCKRTHLRDPDVAKECDPNWKPCVTTTTMEGEKVCQ
jgi:hypothetical protein